MAIRRSDLEPLTRLGASLLPRNLWTRLAGMTEVKRLIESRLILPLANPDAAEELGVRPPRAAVLFGPPGTGKSTFARAIASRLGWPFVELHPSRLAGDESGLAGALRDRFLEITELEHAVVFIDEVDEVAARRGSKNAPSNQTATNELLKSIPAFRERDGRLLLCATNFIRDLDPAFLRHGRFDYIIPVGVPDLEARQSIWRRYLPASSDDIDLLALARATERFSPADIEFAARKAAQTALEHLTAHGGVPIDAGMASRTEAYLAAIGSTRPTVSPSELEEFVADIRDLSRT